MSNVIHLIKFDLDTPVYLTDCDRDYPYNGHVYVAGKVKINTSLKQKAEPSANDFSLLLSAVDQTMVSAFTSAPYKGKQCLVERAELNEDETINSVETWLDGDLNKYSFSDKTKESTMKISVGSVFAAFESINMINILVKFADTINVDEIKYWGKVSPTVNNYNPVRDSQDRPDWEQS